VRAVFPSFEGRRVLLRAAPLRYDLENSTEPSSRQAYEVLKTERDLATFVDGLKTVESGVSPAGREPSAGGKVGLPDLQSSGAVRIALAATFAIVVFFVTLVGLAKVFAQP
jgi:hypothetical protein